MEYLKERLDTILRSLDEQYETQRLLHLEELNAISELKGMLQHNHISLEGFQSQQFGIRESIESRMTASEHMVVELRNEEAKIRHQIFVLLQNLTTNVTVAENEVMTETMELSEQMQQTTPMPLPPPPPDDMMEKLDAIQANVNETRATVAQILPAALECEATKLELQKTLADYEKRLQTKTSAPGDVEMAAKYRMDVDTLRSASRDASNAQTELINLRKEAQNQNEMIQRLRDQVQQLYAQLQASHEKFQNLNQELSLSQQDQMRVQNLVKEIQKCREAGMGVVQRLHRADAAAKNLYQDNQMLRQKLEAMNVLMIDASALQKRLSEEHERHKATEKLLGQKLQSEEKMQTRLQALEESYAANVMAHKQYMTQCEAKLANMTQKAPRASPPPLAAASPPSPPLTVTDVLSECHRKESDIMRNRLKTLQEVAKRIESAQPSTSAAIQGEIQLIRQRGMEREKQHMDDLYLLQEMLLKLKADLGNETTRQNMEGAKNKLMKMVAYAGSESRSSDFAKQAQLYDEQNRARQRQVRERLAWQKEIENAGENYRSNLMTMQTNENKIAQLIDAKKLPELEALKNEMTQNADLSLEALEAQNASSQETRRETSLLTHELNAVMTEQRQLLASLDDFLRENSPEARRDLIELGNKTIQEQVRKRSQEASLRQQVRWNIILGPVLRPRSPGEVAQRLAAERGLKVNQDLNMVQIVSGPEAKETAQIPITKFFPDTLSVYEPLTDLTKPRVALSLVQKKDLIVVSYALNQPDKEKEARRVVIESAIRHISPKLQDTDMELSVIALKDDGTRQDLLGSKQALKPNCNLETCGVTWKKIYRVNNIWSEVQPLIGKDHLVVSLRVPRQGSEPMYIHIVDVLLSKDANDFNVIDQSWLNYLSPTIEKSDVNLDLYFVIVQNQDNTDANNRLLMYSNRIVTFLNALKAASGRV